ncbi:putative two-component system response regulator [Natronincola peptidivorans]|uniref:Putative two-component system response regulator n=1 Tax=Natronincola peptidivorans TaxID=426128 RepID=A0A1I0F8Y2_9FIRM|nr:HD domain-containing phosphohydrolase [Natronincola peptidivorans]SET54450.1 putative two-component system response regulator [Natronincola peptidivorans]
MLIKELPNQRKVFIITCSMCLFCYIIVYLAGGTSSAFPHLFYFPIIIAAQFGTWKIVLFTSVFSSILMSYWVMPLSIPLAIQQGYFGWLFRGAMYIFTGIAIKMNTDNIREKNLTIMKKSQNLMAMQQATFIGMLNLAESRDLETTAQHLERLSYYAEILLREMNVPDKLKENIITYIPFHDIGKVAIPDSILLKPAKLTAEEFQITKQHTIIGGKIIEDIERLTPLDEKEIQEMILIVKEIVYFHHERPDGTGYPYGLRGEEIPFSAKVTAVCDVYDALASERPYKKPIPHEKCVEIIKAGRGTQFDEEIVDCFLQVHNEFRDIYRNFRDKQQVQLQNICTEQAIGKQF